MIMTRAVAAMTHATSPVSAEILPSPRGLRQLGMDYNDSLTVREDGGEATEAVSETGQVPSRIVHYDEPASVSHA